MDTIGLDLHKRESQLCIGQDDGTTEERRIATTRERFTAVLGGRSRARILLEASTESEWVARHLESLGHEVIVADPNFAPVNRLLKLPPIRHLKFPPLVPAYWVNPPRVQAEHWGGGARRAASLSGDTTRL